MKTKSLAARVALMAAAALMIGSPAFGAEIDACYSNKTGALRIATVCKSTETALSWNQAGPSPTVSSVEDLTLGASGLITSAYQGATVFLFLKDLPNLIEALKQQLGVSTLTLTDIQEHVRRLGLTVEAYGTSNPLSATFQGFRWARVTGAPTGTDEADIQWPILVTVDASGTSEDTDPTYKLIRVTAYLK